MLVHKTLLLLSIISILAYDLQLNFIMEDIDWKELADEEFCLDVVLIKYMLHL